MSDILIVDDEKDIRELVADILEDEGYSTALAKDSDETFAAVETDPPKLIILDIWLKDSPLDGIDILKEVKQNHPDIPVVIISGHGNIEIAVAAIKQGAYDFIEKPFNIDQLTVVISRAMEASRLRLENAALRYKDSDQAVMIGASANFKLLKQQLDKVTIGNSRVMLTGPSGAGKEVAARYIHANSPRAKGAFVTVNSAAISPDKMETVLFGTEGKDHGIKAGLLEQSNGGVLFFDEVADMPLQTQSKILRVLVEQQFQRVGGKEKINVDIRVLSSTNKDLNAEMEAGNFREELFHRLNVVPISVPSLEARIEDVPLLAEHFIEILNAKQGLPKREISSAAMSYLQTRAWPGNIRQLRNIIERALILGAGDGPIQPDELQPSVDQKSPQRQSLVTDVISMPLREARESFEREYLLTQINRFGGNISRTANFVGMERSALHRKLKILGVKASAQAEDSLDKSA